MLIFWQNYAGLFPLLLKIFKFHQEFLFINFIRIRHPCPWQPFHWSCWSFILYSFQNHSSSYDILHRSFYSNHYFFWGFLIFSWFYSFHLWSNLGLNWVRCCINWQLLYVFIWKILLYFADFRIALGKQFFIFVAESWINIVKLLILVYWTIVFLYWACHCSTVAFFLSVQCGIIYA
jgi:hypothetical protein